MSWIYNFVFLIFALVSIPKFLVRLNQAKDAGELLRERFGVFPDAFGRFFAGEKTVWLHAVSVGEVMAARAWLEQFLERYKDWKIALSVTTPTGYSVAQKLPFERVMSFYAPFDFSFAVKRAISVIRPKLVLLMETEIWPNFISEVSRAGIPVGIMNGRISPRAFWRYRLARFWTWAMLGKLSFCLAQSERDRGFFQDLGMAPEKLMCTGNMKFDSIQTVRNENDGYSREELHLSGGALILVGGSTHRGEEEMLLKIVRHLKSSVPNIRLILAPRHPERTKQVAELIVREKLSVQLFSRLSKEPWDVLLIDRMGILASIYALADIVFMGGSMIPHGGQNPIEAALEKKPVLHGPYVSNFQGVYRTLNEEEAAFEVRSEDELFRKVYLLLQEQNTRKQMGNRAFQVVESMKGATGRALDYVANWISNHHEPSTLAKGVSYEHA